jgi:hypothetical protein
VRTSCAKRINSLRPRQLLVGKLPGLGALTAVPYAIWIILGGLVRRAIEPGLVRAHRIIGNRARIPLVR